MKKFLFTLCAVLVGFAANADGVQLRLVDNSGNPCNEIHAKAGDKINMHIELTAIDGYCSGAQMQYFMKGVDGTAYDTEDGPVVIAKVGGSYIRPEGMSKLNGNATANNLNPVDGPNAYRVVCTNTTYNVFWMEGIQNFANFLGEDVSALLEDYDPPFTEAMFTKGNVFTFRVQVNDGWTEEYATFEFDSDFSKFSHFTNQKVASEPLTLKIINDDYSAPVTLQAPEIAFEQTDDLTMKVTVTCPTEGASLIVNGEEVGLAPYTYTVTRSSVYEAKTVDVTAKSVLGEETSEVVTRSQAFEPVQEKTKPNAPTYTVQDFETYVLITVTYYGDGTKVLMDENGGDLTNPIRVNKTYEQQTYKFTAYNEEGATMLQSYILNAEVTIPAMEKPTAAKPVITFTETKEGDVVTAVTVEIENWTSAVINGETFTPTRGAVKTFTANYTADQVINVEATNAPGEPYVAATEEDTYTLKKLAQIPSEPAQFRTTQDDDYVYVWADGPGVILYDENGQEVDPQPYKIARPEYDPAGSQYTYVRVSATTQNEGEQYEMTTTGYTVQVPMKENPNPQPTEKTGQPVFNQYTTDGIHAYYVQINNSTAGATIYYRVYLDGVLQNVTNENPNGWMTYEDVLAYTTNGSYRVEAYAVADGYLPSDPIACEFVVSETTGLVDVLNGKTVANVRYFNMAGQEMQEANGMTIVVTTYTDGTSSAVKVMK